jgi:hypothetical protein
MGLYALVDRCNRGQQPLDGKTRALLEQGLADYPHEWLLRAEILCSSDAALADRARSGLEDIHRSQPALRDLVGMALDN